ncbi:glycine, glutamate and proline-rich protein-like [Babylonia areolata]|uniref:glycine, glutamate and proline-rich protein-like n=1 Tax=Babylonia areolata TaxID=304850 RepID=UPI003FCFCB2B
MMLFAVALTTVCLLPLAFGSDAPCHNTGGTCQDDSSHCSGHYQSGLCSGAASRRCCIPSHTSSGSGSYNCFGDFMHLHPTGASAQTAHQDGISHGGVSASQRMVSNDYHELNKRKHCYVQAGNNNCIHPAVIAGIASRETRGGAIIASTGGWGDHHHAYGIMQCDGGASGLGSTCTKYPWDSCEHIDMMVRILLVPYVHTMQSKHSSWRPEQQLQGAVSAYNAGTGNVVTFSGMDLGTTGNDYSNDVMARAQYLVSHYGW